MSSQSSVPTGPALDERRLRAALRLILAPDPADRAAARIAVSADPLSELRAVAGELDLTRRFARLTDRCRDRQVRSEQRPVLVLPANLSMRAMLELLTHVGVDVDGERLEDAFGLDSDVLGRELLSARAPFGGSIASACNDIRWIIGRYRDRSLGSDERVRLLSHATSCEVCRDALVRAQQADSRLLEALERELAALPEPGPQWAARADRARRHAGAIAIVAGLIVALLTLLTGASIVGRLVAPSAPPTPLFAGAAAPDDALDGWLLQVSPVGYLEGVNLATGQKRGLDSGDIGGAFSPLYRVSRTHIAAWRPSDGQRDDVLTIGPIGEPVDFRLTWSRPHVYWYPSGWLDDDTLLIVKSPEHIDGETEQQYVERLTRESRLIAFDAVTGDEQTLMTGNVAAAFPSPDGRMLAILQPIDRRWPGNTLELRPFDGQAVGEPIIRIEHRVVAEGLWLTDSSRYVTSVITDPRLVTRDPGTAGATGVAAFDGVALVSIARDGSRSTLAQAAAPETIVPVAASPDGQSIVYQSRLSRSGSDGSFPGVPAFDWRCYRLPTSGGESELLAAGASPERIFQPAWSPDGTTLILPIARAFPLSSDGEIDQPINPNATTLLVFSPAWRPGSDPRAIYSGGRDLYGWLPAGALESRPGSSNSTSRTLASIYATAEAHIDHAIGAESVVAGAHIVAHERGDHELIIWDVVGGRHRRLAEGSTDLAWFNGGQSTIGVAPDPDVSSGSRIILNAADISSSAAYLDYRVFDPAGLGESRDRRYARPLVSPSGTIVSFFVVDRRTGQVSLWLDDSSGPASIVAEWTLPDDRFVEPPVVATWANPDTLLFARPGDWRDGLPRRVVLARVVVSTGGSQVDDLASLEAIHGAMGVTLIDLALSPDAGRLAYRLRHYESASGDSPTDDTLHVAGTDDLGHAIELERGGFGEGLTWTPSGDELIAGVRGRIALYSPDGRDLQHLSPRGVQASHPVVIGDQVWFEAVDDHGGSVWSVDLE